MLAAVVFGYQWSPAALLVHGDVAGDGVLGDEFGGRSNSAGSRTRPSHTSAVPRSGSHKEDRQAGL